MKRMVFNASDLEKIKVVEVKNYNLASNETYEKVSTIDEFKGLISVIKNMKDYSTQFPLILVNIVSDDSESHTFLCVIPYDEQSEDNKTIHYTEQYQSSIVYYTLEYDVQKDTINIRVENEIFLTEDNIKTIFGQYITGTGDITLYRHQLSLSANQYDCGAIIYSANKLKIDSLQDLTKLLNPTAGFGVSIQAFDNTTNLESNRNVLIYDGTNWKIGLGKYNSSTGAWSLAGTSSEYTLVTSINDIVTPL